MSDDFTRIRGMNEYAATRLGEAGILTYSKLASMTPEEIVSRIGRDSGYTAETIERRDWINQANALATKPVAEESPQTEDQSVNPLDPDLKPELTEVSYVVELLTDKNKRVWRTRVLHVNSNEDQSWDGWHNTRLLQYFAKRTELNLAEKKSDALLKKLSDSGSAPISVKRDSEPLNVREPRKAEDRKPTLAPLSQASKVRLLNLNVIDIKTNQICSALIKGQEYAVRLKLAFNDFRSFGPEPLYYAAKVYANGFNGGWHQTISKTSGRIEAAPRITLDLPAEELPTGLFRFAASITLDQRKTGDEKRQTYQLLLESGMIQVTGSSD